MGTWPESRGSRRVGFSRLGRAWPGRIGQVGAEGESGGAWPGRIRQGRLPAALAVDFPVRLLAHQCGLEPRQDQDAPQKSLANPRDGTGTVFCVTFPAGCFVASGAWARASGWGNRCGCVHMNSLTTICPSTHWSTEQVPREVPLSLAGSPDEDSEDPDYVNQNVAATEA